MPQKLAAKPSTKRLPKPPTIMRGWSQPRGELRKKIVAGMLKKPKIDRYEKTILGGRACVKYALDAVGVKDEKLRKRIHKEVRLMIEEYYEKGRLPYNYMELRFGRERVDKILGKTRGMLFWRRFNEISVSINKELDRQQRR